MNYLTKAELLDLHAYMLERYGGRMGIASLDRLTHVLDAPRQVMFGVELYPDLPSKAAALTFLIILSTAGIWTFLKWSDCWCRYPARRVPAGCRALR